MQWQPPRFACYSDLRQAYRAKKPISLDFQYENATVYFIAFAETGLIKIGISNNVADRMKTLQHEAA